jgi:hypothetical protein
MSNIELARAYVTIVPSMEGAQETIASELSGVDFSSQGSTGGADFGDAFSSALLGAGSIALSIGSQIASGLAEGATALANFTAQGGAYADEVLTMSTNTHIATEDLQAYMYAAELVDVSTETLTSSMARNVRSMNSAANGTGAVADAYAALGVAVTDSDGNLRDSQTVYWELIDALGQVDDYTQRDALSMQIFGRSAQDLNSLIAVGSDGMAQYAQQAQEAGAILDGDTLEAFGAFDDVTHQLDSGMQAAQNALGTILLPILTEMGTSGVDLLGQFTQGILAANGDITQMGAVFDTIVPQLTSLISTYLPTLVNIATTIIITLANALIANLPTILSGAGEVLFAICEGIIAVLPQLAPVAADLIVRLVEFLIENLPTVIDSAVLIIIAVTEGIANALPELIPAVIQCIYTITETLMEHLDEIIAAAQDLFFGIVEGLIQATPTILAEIPTLITSMLEEFGQLGPQLVENAFSWGADLIDSLIDGINSLLGNLGSTVSDVASTIASYLHFSVPDRGPLSDMDVHGGAGLMRSFIEGIEDGGPELEATLNRTLSLPTMAAPELISDMSGTGGNIVIPVNIGQERLDTILIRADQLATYRRGG